MPQLISTFPALPLTYQCTVVWEAWAPDGSAQVTGVTITDPVLYGLNLTPGGEPSSTIEPVAPLFVPLPLSDLNPPDEETP